MSETIATDPNIVPVPKAQLDELMSYKARATEAEAARQSAETRRLLEAGQAESVLKLHQQQLAAADERGKKQAITTEIMRSLSGVHLVDEAAAGQLTALLRDELVADASADGYTVRTPTYQSASDFIKAALAKPDYQHFLATQPTANKSTRPGTPGTSPPAGEPETLGHAAVQRFQAAKAAQTQTDGRMASGRSGPLPGFGLKPLR